MTKEEAGKLSRLPAAEVGDDYEVFRLKPEQLLTSSNYVDILAKYMYGKARRDGTLTPWVTNLYVKHLLVHNKLFDGVERISAAAFLESFHRLLDSVEKEGFDERKSIIAATKGMDLVDGSHRVAAALVYGSDITVVRTETPPHLWGADSFRKRGLDEEFLDQTALEYVKMNPHTRLTIVFPLVKEKYAEIRGTLLGHTICYEKDFIPTIHGIGNLIAQMYKPKEWLNARTRDRHAIRRFVAGQPVRLLLLLPSSRENLIRTKAKIRGMFDHENLPIHISDDHEETVRVAEQVFNENSIHFFNNTHPTKFKNFSKLFERYKSWIEKNKYNKNEFCIDGSAVMAAYGLRDCGDLDYLSFCDKRCDLERIRSHNDFLYLHDRPIKELIFDPRNYFFYDGYKFLTLDCVMRMKKRRKDPQDKRDIEFILSVPRGRAFYKKFAFALAPKNIWNYIVMHGAHALWRLYLMLPKRFRPIAIKIYHPIIKGYQAIRKLIWKY